MFEKEAEEYADVPFAPKTNSELMALCFKDGAEFGYNKANEWHYPSKGEYPECDENTLLMIYVTCYYEVGGSSVTRNRTVLGYYQKSFMNDDVKVFVEKSKGYSDEHLPKDVIGWKEIVLPKESE